MTVVVVFSVAGLASISAAAAAITGSADALRAATSNMVTCVRIQDSRIEIDCATRAIAEALDATWRPQAPAIITLTADVRLTRSGRVMRLVQPSGAGVTPTANSALVRLLIKARRWWGTLKAGEVDIKTLAAAEGVAAAYVTRVVRLAFLAPAVVEAILAGKTRAGVDGAALTATGAVSPLWDEQVAAWLPGSLVR